MMVQILAGLRFKAGVSLCWTDGVHYVPCKVCWRTLWQRFQENIVAFWLPGVRMPAFMLWGRLYLLT